MNADQIIEWVVDYCRGQMSDREKQDFESWLGEDENNPALFTHYKKTYINARQAVFLKHVDEDRAWENIVNEFKTTDKRVVPVWMFYAAAVCIVAVLSTWFVWNEVSKINTDSHHDFEQLAETGCRRAILTLDDGTQCRLAENGQQEFNESNGTLIIKDSINNLIYNKQDDVGEQLIYNEIEVPKAGEYALTLSDGTRVWLNADSKLRYPVSFDEKQRDVYLSGEACFDVTHNPKAPFTIYVHDTEVKVLGTYFNISAYDNQACVATTLVKGSVQVKHLSDEVTLAPGNQSLVEKGKDGIRVADVDAALYIAWVNGVFEFENKDLAYITAQLGRWYNVDFFFKESELKHIKFTGAIKRDKSINYAIKLIESVTDVSFKVEGEQIIIEK